MSAVTPTLSELAKLVPKLLRLIPHISQVAWAIQFIEVHLIGLTNPAANITRSRTPTYGRAGSKRSKLTSMMLVVFFMMCQINISIMSMVFMVTMVSMVMSNAIRASFLSSSGLKL